MKMTVNYFICALFLITALFPLTLKSNNHVERFSLDPKPSFIENKGQITDQHGRLIPEVKYLYSAPGFKMAMKEKGFSYEIFTIEKEEKISEATATRIDRPFTKSCEPEDIKIKSHRIDVVFLGANSPEIIASEKSSDYNNYYLAHTPEDGVRSVFSFQKITYRNIYKNIDLVFYAHERKLKYDIVVHPGGNLKDVKFRFNGMSELSLNEGKLITKTSLGNIEESIPFSFLDETKEEMAVNFILNRNVLSFSTKKYDKKKTLVVDPQLEWGTYFGGNAEGLDVFTKKSGDLYVTGRTYGISGISTTGAYQVTLNGPADALIIKFDNNGIRIWGTYYGGSDKESGISICGEGEDDFVYITGHTLSTSGIATSGVHQSTYGGNDAGKGDVFVAKFDKNGFREWGSYFGGPFSEEGNSITTDGKYVYITGVTRSTTGIATVGAHQTVIGGGNDAFVVKFDPSGIVHWATYFGGSGIDEAYGITYDNINNIFITGKTLSNTGIATPGAHETNRADIFIAKFNEQGILQWGSYYGAMADGQGNSLITDSGNNVYLAGWTTALTGIASPGSFQENIGGNEDAFLIKFNSNGIREWGTYFGGGNNDNAAKVCLDIYGNVFISGATNSTTSIATQGSHQPTSGGSYDAYLSLFNNNGMRLWSTYFGGTGHDYGYALTSDTTGNIFISGYTSSSTNIATQGAHQTTPGGGFVAKFNSSAGCNLNALINGPQFSCDNETKSYTSNKGAGLSYNWTVAGGIISSGQGTDSIMVNWNTTGQGYVKVVVSSSINCEDSISIPITVEQLANSNFTYLTNGLTAQFFPQDTTHLNYQWDFGDGNFSTDKFPVHTYAIEGQYEVELLVSNSNGCDSPFKQQIDLLLDVTKNETSSYFFNSFYSRSTENLTINYTIEKPDYLRIEISD